MDASNLAPKLKVQKLVEEQNISEGQDRLSSLPKSIIHHILSFLPTKYAVGTSILSKRWRYHWTSVSILDIRDEDCADDDEDCADDDEDCADNDNEWRGPVVEFMNFVDRVLFFHESNIDKFFLICKTAHDADRVNAWISTVVRRKVCELVIDIVITESFAFPRCLLGCEFLRVLIVKMQDALTMAFTHLSSLQLPTCTTFSGLKVLHLEVFKFTCEQSVQQVTLRFPILEEFLLEECAWLQIKTINIYAPSLKKLGINDPSFISNYELYGYEMKIYAENLTSLSLNSGVACLNFVNNLASIVDALIDLRREDTLISVITLLKDIRNVKDLTISNNLIEALVRADISADIPKFPNVINLGFFTLLADSVSNLMNLLRDMPSIESLVFPKGFYKCSFEEHYLTVATFPQSFLSHLKSVVLNIFNGSEGELYLVRFLLKNASELQKITLRYSQELSKSPEKQNAVMKKLLMFPRVSPCVIDVL